MEKQKQFIIHYISLMDESDSEFLKKICSILHRYLLRRGGH